MEMIKITKKLYTESYIEDIADSIRALNDSQSTMKISQMDNNINSFKTQYDLDKSLLRTNLATKGINSQSNDSLTTLANKILNIISDLLIIDNSTDFYNLLTNGTLKNGDIIFLKSGTYTGNSNNFDNLPSIMIFGDPSNPPIFKLETNQFMLQSTKNESNSSITIKNINIDGQGNTQTRGVVIGGYQTVNVNNVNVSNCLKDYNTEAITVYVNQNNIPSVNINNCTLLNNKTTQYGHSPANIIIIGANISNVNIHNCTLDTTTSNNRNVHTQRGICLHNWSNNCTVNSNTCIASCNTYTGDIETYNITESQCPST